VSLITTLTESEAHAIAVAGIVVVVATVRVDITEVVGVVVIRRTKKVYRLFPL
jgi:hypothetical protein